MALAYRASSYVGTGGASGDALAVTKAVGAASGDVLVCCIYWETDSNSITPPAGWTSALRQVNTGLFMVEVFTKLAGGSEPSTYTFTPATNGQWRHASMVAYSGGTGSGTLVDVTGGSQGDGQLEANQTAPSVTTTGTDRMLVRGGGNFNGIPTSASGAASNFRGAGGGSSMTDALRASSGATGTTHVIGAGSDDYVGIHAAIISDTGGGTKSIPPGLIIPRWSHRTRRVYR